MTVTVSLFVSTTLPFQLCGRIVVLLASVSFLLLLHTMADVETKKLASVVSSDLPVEVDNATDVVPVEDTCTPLPEGGGLSLLNHSDKANFV